MAKVLREIAKAYGGKISDSLRVPVSALYFDPKYDLRNDLGDIDWIMENIRRDGFWKKEPIETRPHKDSQKLEIVDGRRRFRACLKVIESGELGNWDGLVEVTPQYNMSDVELLFKTVTSNNDSRKPFDMMEEGNHFKLLIEEFMVEKEEIAKRIGKSITYVLDRLALANMDSKMKDDVSNFISSGVLSPTAATKIAKISDKAERDEVWKEIKSQHNATKNPDTKEITIVNGKKVETSTVNGKEVVKHPKKIKVSDVIKGSKKGIEHISIKVVKANLEKCEAMHKETGADYWECGVKVLKAILENKIID